MDLSCENRGTCQFAHKRAFRFKGVNKAFSVGRYCRSCHRALDDGELKVVQGADGPLVVDRRGRVVGRLRRPGPS